MLGLGFFQYRVRGSVKVVTGSTASARCFSPSSHVYDLLLDGCKQRCLFSKDSFDAHRVGPHFLQLMSLAPDDSVLHREAAVSSPLRFRGAFCGASGLRGSALMLTYDVLGYLSWGTWRIGVSVARMCQLISACHARASRPQSAVHVLSARSQPCTCQHWPRMDSPKFLCAA